MSIKNLLILVPCFKKEIVTEKIHLLNFSQWFVENRKKFEEKGVFPTMQPLARGKPLVDTDTGKENVYFGLVKKGELLTKYLKKMKNDNGEMRYDFAIAIDGDGDIPYNKIFDILDLLLEGNDVCLTCRKGEFGLGEERDIVERFELFILEKVFKKSLPDGQCGCWGISYGASKKFYEQWSAVSFEIELDLLINALTNNLVLSFTSANVKSVESSFNEEDSKTKLDFLVKKLQLNKDNLHEIYSDFFIYHNKSLPNNYVSLFSDYLGECKIEISKNAERDLPKCDTNPQRICTKCFEK